MEVRARVVIQENERDWKSIKGINSSWFNFSVTPMHGLEPLEY